MGSQFSCVRSVDGSDSLHNCTQPQSHSNRKKVKGRKREKGKKKEKNDKTSSNEAQSSQHVTSTSKPEVLPIAEEPGHAEVNDEWSEDVFQDLVGDSSEWSADVLFELCLLSLS